MKIRLELISQEDSQTGELGWIFSDININEDLFMSSNDPLLLAHDFLEHPNGLDSIGSIDDEMQALGGIWFVRGQFGLLRKDNVGMAYSIEQHLASDLSRMYREQEITSYTMIDDSERAEIKYSAIDNDVIETAKEIIELARNDINSELEDGEQFDIGIDEYLADAKLYFLLGYQRSVIRFDDDANSANELFWNIVSAFDSVDDPEWEEREINLVINGDRVYVDEPSQLELDEESGNYNYGSEQELSDAFDQMITELDAETQLKFANGLDIDELNQTFNDWTDGECKDGSLSDEQYRNYCYIGKHPSE